MSPHIIDELLQPRSIAIVGASDNQRAQGYNYTAALIDFGYRGKIYPVNPKYSEILGLKVYPRVKDIPGPVDYVISAVPARMVPAMLEDCSHKGVKIVHLFTGRFSETGRPDAVKLEQEVLEKVRKFGIRLIGPNCMGLYFPRLGISFSDSLPNGKYGSLGLISQSGQAVNEIVRAAELLGLYFSKAISYGNALDLNECDFLEYLAQDPETKIILMYVEGLKDGPRFAESLRKITEVKPVVILKGGRSQSGTRAVASHTASLAGSADVWENILKQAGAVSADSLEEFMDIVLAFYYLPPIKGVRVGVMGGAGGASVLAADQCEAAGLDVVQLPPEFRQELKSRGISIWDWIGNPVDGSIRESDDFNPGDILEMMSKNENFDLMILMFGEPHHRRDKDRTADDYIKQYSIENSRIKPVMAVVPEKSLTIDRYEEWGWKIIYEIRAKLLAAGIPFYPSIGRAAKAAHKVADYFRRRDNLTKNN